MEPIADLNVLQAFSIAAGQRLGVGFNAAGGGQIVSHALYEPDELQRLRKKVWRGLTAKNRCQHRPHRGCPVAAAHNPSSRVEEELRSLHHRSVRNVKDVEALIEKQLRQEQTLADLRSSLGG